MEDDLRAMIPDRPRCIYEGCTMTHICDRDPRVCWIHWIALLMNQCSRLGCERQIKHGNRALCGACFMRYRRGGEIRDPGPTGTANIERTFDSSWRKDAACIGADPDLFYPEGDKRKIAQARAICAQCPVIEECREFALKLRDPFGIFGGTTPVERLVPRREVVGA
jgi:WhiB family transcriptional regulator, redox-sensing transcriptional regulator